MKIYRVRAKALHLGVFSFLVMISIGYLTTNNYSRFFIEPLRMVSVVSVVLSLIVVISKSKLCYKHLTGLLLYVLLLVLGISLSMLNGSLEIGSSGLLVNSLVTICGILLLGYHSKNILSIKFAIWFVAYVSIGALFTIIIGGLEFTPLPNFNFQYDTGVHAMEVLYSQGISKFFGFGAIASAFLVVNANGKLGKYFCFSLVIIFLSLSLLGGGRGDSIFAFFLVICYLIISNPIRGLLWLGLISFAIYILVKDWFWLDDFLIFQRLSDLDGNFGQRDILLAKALDLMLMEPTCLVFGCGFGYFQSYFGYVFGMYPHNILVELFIVFGIPVALAFVFVVAGGVLQYYRRTRGSDLFVLFFIYSLLVGLKSGSLFGDWFFTASCIYFSSVYIQKMVVHVPIRIWMVTPALSNS